MEQVDGDVRRSDALRAAIRRSPWRVLCLGSSIPSGCFRATAMSLKGRKPPPSRLHERVICQSDQLQPNHTTGRLSAPAPTSCARNYPGSLGGLTPQGLGNGEGEPLGASAWNSSRRGFVIFQSTARPPHTASASPPPRPSCRTSSSACPIASSVPRLRTGTPTLAVRRFVSHRGKVPTAAKK